MMKKIIWPFCATLFLIGCSTKKAETETRLNTDLISQNLKGNVKQVETTFFTPDSTGKVDDMDSCCIEVAYYDELGYITNEALKKSDGTIKNQTMITRHDKGQAKEYTTMENGQKTASFVQLVGTDGKFTGAQSYDSTGKLESYYTDLLENEYGAVYQGKEYRADSTLKSSFKAVYDNATFMGGEEFDNTGKVFRTTRVKLNDRRDIIERMVIEKGKDSTTTKITVYKYENYDPEGNWIERTTYDQNGKLTKVMKRNIIYYDKSEK